jgi:hypothetical protein
MLMFEHVTMFMSEDYLVDYVHRVRTRVFDTLGELSASSPPPPSLIYFRNEYCALVLIKVLHL